MIESLEIVDRQRSRPLDRQFLHRLILHALVEGLNCKDFGLCVHLVDTPEIIHLNEAYLNHRGPTDVITFDYCEPATRNSLAGEIFVCVPEAESQAARFRTTWQSEVVRYIVHSILHLLGYDDRNTSLRKRMKEQEDRLLASLKETFLLERLRRPIRKAPKARLAGRTNTKTPKKRPPSRRRH